MADKQLALCEPLCFVRSKLGKVDVKSIKTVVKDYYSLQEVSQAKAKLLEDIERLNCSAKVPHVPSRREGPNRFNYEVDDFFNLIEFTDENKLFDQLPAYVTDNPDHMPSMRLFDGDLNFIVKYLEKMEDLLNSGNELYEHMTIDLYNQGLVLKRKYNLLVYAYQIFMFGFILSVLIFLVFLAMG